MTVATPIASDPEGPRPSFEVLGAAVPLDAAAPTIGVRLRIDVDPAVTVRSILLRTQVRIAAPRRSYDRRDRERLRDVFGTEEQWSRSLGSLFWTNVVAVVPAFAERTSIELALPVTYDLEVSSARYFHALDEGDVPLDFLFSGSVFWEGADGAVRASLIPWNREASLAMPIAVWKEALERHYPQSAWLRVHRDVFDRIQDFRTRHTLPTTEAAIEALIESALDRETGH